MTINLTSTSLQAIGIKPTQAQTFLEPLRLTLGQFRMDVSLQRSAAFIAQCAHESAMFVSLDERLFYRDPKRIKDIFPSSVKSMEFAQTLVGQPELLANTVYANRNGNGPPESGDGYRYRGRGLFQLTGRANYTAATMALGEPYVDLPDLVAQPAGACLTAGWFWNRKACNSFADASDIDHITLLINGAGMAGKDERRDLYRRALQALRS